jgi:UDP:flavonoid glycosyltransferase YjiC (YdhE family)
MASLVWYCSAHGFGHAVRSGLILAEVRRRAPSLAIHVRAAAPPWFFPPGVDFRRLVADFGIAQQDSVTEDLDGTLSRATEFAAALPALLADETAFLRSVDAALVVGDLPPLAFLAAQAAGVPAVGLGNFAWDWIYAAYAAERPAFARLAADARAAYGHAALLLRLPFHGDMSAFGQIEDVPLVARQAPDDRAACRAQFQLPPAAKIVLLSFGGIGLERFPYERLPGLADYYFVATDPAAPRLPNLRVLSAQLRNYQTLVRAADVVVTKPGYGIVADCLAAQTRVLYSDRGAFPEYPILVDALETCGPALHLPRAALLAGDLGPALDRLLALERPWRTLRLDGAAVAARRLLEHLGDAA